MTNYLLTVELNIIMGRRSNIPVSLVKASEVSTEVPFNDGLPSMANFIDVNFARANRKILTRIFLKSPIQEDIYSTLEIRKIIGRENLIVIGAQMPYMNNGVHVTSTLYDYCVESGLSAEFSLILTRIFINYFIGRSFAPDTIADKFRAYRGFIDFACFQTDMRSQLTLNDLNKQFWLNFLEFVELNNNKPDQTFNDVRGVFKCFPPATLNGWLLELSCAKRNLKEADEHSSELVDAAYTDSVMYQILALCLEGFQRRIGYLKRYESLTEADMPLDWLYPGRDNRKLVEGTNRIGLKKGMTFETESSRLLIKWLKDEDIGYSILIDHFILHHKSGLIKKTNSNRFTGGIVSSLGGLANKSNDAKMLLDRFWKVTANWHGFKYPSRSRAMWNFYLKKKSSIEINIVINQIAWCLGNLLMMQTGINKEVALSIPSRSENGDSILSRSDSLFISKNEGSTEVELYGFKERGGGERKKIAFSIVKDSPIYEMLTEYEKYVKVDFEGPFFEINKKFKRNWNEAGGIADFKEIYPIFENGSLLKSINTIKFRKVFATGQLLDRIQGIKNGNDLAEKIQEDLKHGSLDVTLTHYLLKTNVGRSVIDTAIATITSEKLVDALHFKGTVALDNQHPIKKKVFLCDCEDPLKPSHDLAIADECKHYDLCLGCERSVITDFHLPYIAARIIQYEAERAKDPYIWPATFENLWCIAHDALQQYQIKNNLHGKRLVTEAWTLANNGQITLPPIINTNRL